MSLRIAQFYAELTAKDSLTPALQNASTELGNFSGALKAGIGQLIGITSVAGLAMEGMKLFDQSIAASAEEETGLTSLNATIQSMGLSSEISGEQIRKMAEAMQTANGEFSHDDLERAAQSFLRLEGFDPTSLKSTLSTIEDFAAGKGMNAADAAQQVAQALETGQVRSLGFSAALRGQVQDMISAGDKAGALALIMDTLNSKYGGQAAAALDTYNGKLKTRNNLWDEYLATAGGAALPAGKGLLDNENKLILTTTQLTTIQQQLTHESFSTLDIWEKMALWTLGGPINDFKILVGYLTTNLPHGIQYSEDSITSFGKNTDEVIRRAVLGSMSDFDTELQKWNDGLADAARGIRMTQDEIDALHGKDTDIRITTHYIDDKGNLSGGGAVNPYQPGSAQYDKWNETHNVPFRDVYGPSDYTPPSGNTGLGEYIGTNVPGFAKGKLYWNGTDYKIGAARGADFIVPSGYSNDSFPMHVQSGEHVQVTPAGAPSNADVVESIRRLENTMMTVLPAAIKAAVGVLI